MSTQKTNTQLFSGTIAPSTLLDATTTAATLVDECKLHLNKDGVRIRAVDPANVGMVDLTLEKNAFARYRGQGDVIGVNLERLNNMLGMLDKNDPATITVENSKLHLESNGMEFNMALIDPDSIRQEPELPDINVPATITLEGSALNQGVKAADMVSDHIILGVNKTDSVFEMSAEGDTDDVSLTLTQEDVLEMVIGEDGSSIFSLDYLKDMRKAIPKDAEVTLDLGEEFPVSLSFNTVYTKDDQESKLDVVFMLAPRIQND